MMSTHLNQAMEGHKVEFRFEYNYVVGTTVHREVIMVPEKNAAGVTETVLCLVVDTTEKTAERIKMSACKKPKSCARRWTSMRSSRLRM